MSRLLNLRLIVGLATLVLAAAVYFGDWVEVSSNSGYSAEALRNRYLAAERFLLRFDIRVELSDGLSLLDELPPPSHTLVIASSRRALSQRRVAGLMDWVKSGGRLILLAGDVWDEMERSSGDKLLDDLGVRLLQPGDNERAGADESVRQGALGRLVNQSVCGGGRHLARIRLVGEEQEIATAMSTSGYLQFEGDHEYAFAENSVGPQLLYIEVGDGAVVALTSLSLWTNRRIHCYDHAHLLRWLTEDRPVLWWLFNTEMRPLPMLVFERFPLLVGLVVCLVLMWAWRSAIRLQRVPAAPDPARRELTEHIDGVARFYWQQRAGARLLEPLRRSVLGGGEISDARIAALAERSGIDRERIRWALTHSPASDSGDFLTAVRVLYDLRKLNG